MTDSEMLNDAKRRLRAQASLINEYRRLGAMVEGPLAVEFKAAAKRYDGSTGPSVTHPGACLIPEEEYRAWASEVNKRAARINESIRATNGPRFG